MVEIGKYIYKIIFWISRFITISVFSICFFAVLNAKYIVSEKFFYILFGSSSESSIFSNFIFGTIELFYEYICNIIDIDIDFIGLNEYNSISIFCINSQKIDLLLIALIFILIMSIIIAKFVKKGYKYLLIINIISSIVYVIMYSMFKLQMMLVLAIVTPIMITILLILNKIFPMQKTLMLLPIAGEIFCIKKIIKYIFDKSDKFTNIGLILTAIIISNIICFLFSYKNFENKIMDNWTYSIKIYQDKMIISGNKELIIINKDGDDTHIQNEQFCYLESFIINEDKKEMYINNFDNDINNFDDYDKLLVIDMNNFDIKDEIKIANGDDTRMCCNSDFSKLILMNEKGKVDIIVDLNTHNVTYMQSANSTDCVIYNKYRNCFLVSFWLYKSFLQEIDVENKKIRRIKADSVQGYIVISEKNKEIYIAFSQQGRIGVYDAETMKLKRKIKSNYSVKNITYDEDLNILIAPSYFTGYVDIFLMDGSDKLLVREFIGHDLREACFDSKKENLYVCSHYGLFKKKIYIKKLIEENSGNKKV